MGLPSDEHEPSSHDHGTDHSRTAARRSLLPAFEERSSSPSLPRPAKRKHEESAGNNAPGRSHYPTPVPTSSTGILPSSPPKMTSTRPGLQRTMSTMSERVPLGTVPTVELNSDGTALLLGRSSHSSDYQLSASRFISRVHVRASYRIPDENNDNGQVVVECLGWNGVIIHCQGRKFELGKGDTFSSEKPLAEIILDVQDSRVLIRWPSSCRKDSATAFCDTNQEHEDAQRRAVTPSESHFASSPPAFAGNLQSPVSPSPRNATASSTFLGVPPSSPPIVHVYEDHTSEDDALPQASNAEAKKHSRSSSLSSSLSDLEDLSDHNEENDPIIYSFGPFGDNLLPKMASFQAVSPERRREPLRASISPRQSSDALKYIEDATLNQIRNHVINQLAYSRLHSLPLSTILNNLPLALKVQTKDDKNGTVKFTENDLKKILDDTACVGGIAREGKDAAGKQLEDEFYYVPELDTDSMRRQAVEGSLGKPGLRAVRKQHKQYYWKRPRF